MKNHKLLQFFLKPIIVILIAAVMYLLKYRDMCLLVLLLYLILQTISLFIYWKKDKNIRNFTKYIERSIGENFLNLLMPIVLIKENGDIVWYNKKFDEIRYKDDDLFNKDITTILLELDLKKIIASDNIIHEKITFNGVNYDIHGEKINNDSEKYILLYLNDIRNVLKKEDLIDNIILLEVDNLSDVLDNTDEDDRPLVVAEIERTINLYASNNNAMIKKYDTNKYVLCMQNNYIEEEIRNKFPILDGVSSINKGNKFEITISMGIGRGGSSPLENYKLANTAIELALGRGGDQVVIKNNEEISFFGGNSKEIEKRTRVRARVVSHALKELIFESNKIYIVGHENPDMDCFGSAVALSSIIKQLGKKCNVVLNNDTKAIEYFLEELKNDVRYYERFINEGEALRDLDDDTLVIIVDVHNRSYVSSLELIEKAKKKVIIDHHRRSPDIIGEALLNYIEVYASSTSEMVSEVIQYINKDPDISVLEAEGLLAGIYMDTKGFSFKTGVRTFEAASFLKGLGADTIEVKKMFTDNLDDYLLIADAIKSAKVDKDKKCAIAVCPSNVNSVIIAKAADELLNISGIEVSFVLGSIDGAIYISGRSVGDINVQVVLEALGGGGHMNIAGTKLIGVSLEEAKEELEDKIEKYLKVGE